MEIINKDIDENVTIVGEETGNSTPQETSRLNENNAQQTSDSAKTEKKGFFQRLFRR